MNVLPVGNIAIAYRTPSNKYVAIISQQWRLRCTCSIRSPVQGHDKAKCVDVLEAASLKDSHIVHLTVLYVEVGQLRVPGIV